MTKVQLVKLKVSQSPVARCLFQDTAQSPVMLLLLNGQSCTGGLTKARLAGEVDQYAAVGGGEDML